MQVFFGGCVMRAAAFCLPRDLAKGKSREYMGTGVLGKVDDSACFVATR